MNMKRMRFYVVLGIVLLLSSGWAETEWDVLSFISEIRCFCDTTSV